MAKRFLTPLNLPNLASNPETGTEGDLYFNTVENVVKIYIGGEWTDLQDGGASVIFQEEEPNTSVLRSGDIWIKHDVFPPGIVTKTGEGFGEIYEGDIYNYQYFLGTGSFEIINNSDGRTIDVLYGAGGGAGGSHQSDFRAGGGGAGGVILATNISIPTGTALNVIIGGGGAKVLNNTSTGARGNNGNNTIITGLAEAIGGGGGGSNAIEPTSGGSGGGGGGFTSTIPGASGTAGQGNGGGNGRAGSTSFSNSGSGGGAGGPGNNGPARFNYAVGGLGANYSSWEIDNYGIGENGLVGGGGSIRTGSTTGGGGRVRNGTSNGPADALVNTSGGGGGNTYEPGFSLQEPGNGGSGFAIFRWER